MKYIFLAFFCMLISTPISERFFSYTNYFSPIESMIPPKAIKPMAFEQDILLYGLYPQKDRPYHISDFLLFPKQNDKHFCSQQTFIRKNAVLSQQILTDIFKTYCNQDNESAFVLEYPGYTTLAYINTDKSLLCINEENCRQIIFQDNNFFLLKNKNSFFETFFQVKPRHLKRVFISLNPKLVLNENQFNILYSQVLLNFINGGFGNLLFQYWSSAVYSFKSHKKFFTSDVQNKLFDIFDLKEHQQQSSLLMQQNEDKKLISFLFQGVSLKGWYNNLLPATEINELSGYLQAWENVAEFETYIQDHTPSKKTLSDQNKKLIHQMQNQNSVALHVRRGDYVRIGIYHLLTPEFYQNAVAYMNAHLDNPHYYIFSNDLAWAKQNLKIDAPHTFVDWNKKDYEDFELMRSCKHFIIANSTFSWWGAFLSKNPDKIVITPKNWIKTSPAWATYMYMPNWLVFDNE